MQSRVKFVSFLRGIACGSAALLSASAVAQDGTGQYLGGGNVGQPVIIARLFASTILTG